VQNGLDTSKMLCFQRMKREQVARDKFKNMVKEYLLIFTTIIYMAKSWENFQMLSLFSTYKILVNWSLTAHFLCFRIFFSPSYTAGGNAKKKKILFSSNNILSVCSLDYRWYSLQTMLKCESVSYSRLLGFESVLLYWL